MNILVVCAGNTCRSPIGAGLLRQIARSRTLNIEAKSAGIFPELGKRVAPLAVEVMNEWGLDISDDYSKPIDLSLTAWADIIIPVQERIAEYLEDESPEIGPKLRRLEEEVCDPLIEDTILAYRHARDTLHRLLTRLVDSIDTAHRR